LLLTGDAAGLSERNPGRPSPHVRFAPIGTTIANSGFAADTKVGGRDFYFAWGCFAEKMNSPEMRFGVGLAVPRPATIP
jgi:hypothetical protein